MATIAFITKILYLLILINVFSNVYTDDILGCGGFVKSHVSLDYSKIEVGLYTKQGSLKEKTECAPTNGYYFLPLYEKGEYVLKVHPPAGWSFEPSQVDVTVDGTTDKCSTGQDINFAFNGFGITGRVITAGQKQGPSGISVELVDDKGKVRKAITSIGGDFHFTPVIPGKYIVKASHPRWKLEPSQAIVQVKEGNTALPVGVLAVKGFDVKGSVTSFGSPISGIYVLLYSKEENPQFRVEGCKTALLQGVPESPICHSITDNNGEFTFGLVPAGHYKLLALSTPPGQVTVSYKVKPDSVPFNVQHDSLYIKNAFEVNGFTVVGTVLSAVSGSGLAGVRVLLDQRPIGKSDASGKFTLPNLQPATYTITFQHEQCEIEPIQLVVSANGPARPPTAAADRWRVCGSVTPADHRDVTIQADKAATRQAVHISPENEGKWCTFLPPGVYSATVDVTDQEQREGLQFFPLSHKISVGNGPVDNVVFSQLKGEVSGRVECLRPQDCRALPVLLKPLSADGGYVGRPRHTTAEDGVYTFPEVSAGSAEVSVSRPRLCWRSSSHNVGVAHSRVSAPAFHQQGYVLRARAAHALQAEYVGPDGVKGVLSVPEGASELCVPRAGQYSLTPRGCHRYSPGVVTARTADTDDEAIPTVYFVAVAHEVTVQVLSPEPVKDLMMQVNADGRPAEKVGPLTPKPDPNGGYSYEHTMFMADGEVVLVQPWSSSLLFSPAQPVQVWGRGTCQPRALTFHALRALQLTGRLRPPVVATLTLTGDNIKLTQTTKEDGSYHFGPLDASKEYTITAEKDSYVFSVPDENGDIVARKLAEITVELLDDADGTPLQGALVSVSGGTYRRNALTGADGRLRFSGLQPDQYYVKPNMKEYKFTPPHSIVALPDGHTHHMTLRGVRVAWSCLGRLVSLGGVGRADAVVAAAPRPGLPARCAPSDAVTAADGHYRIRGLLPDCVYTLQLKDSDVPDLAGLKLVRAPATIEVKDNKDIEDVQLIAIQPHQVTDTNVIIYTPNIDHYKTLRLTLALESSPQSPIYSTKLDAAGYSQALNPGLAYVLPRLPADGKQYILQLESTLSKSSHAYESSSQYFYSDGSFKNFYIEFLPKVKSSEQELRQTSLLIIPFVGLLFYVYQQRASVLERLSGGEWGAAGARGARGARAAAPERAALLDKPTIHHILSAVNAAGKKTGKKKPA